MKTHYVRVLTLIFALAFSCTHAQVKPGVGVETNNPTGALLHIANPDSVAMPSLRLDSIPNISLSTLRYFLAVDTGGNIVGKISANKDSLWNILGGKPRIIPEMIPWGRNTYFGSGGGYPLTNYYRDNDSVLVATQRPNSGMLCVFIKNKNPKFRDITPDFLAASYNNIWVNSAVVLDGYLYLLGINNLSNTRKLLRYDLNNLTLAPIEVTFSGSRVLTNSTGNISMGSDGIYFYFSHDCGANMSADNIIVKYSLLGTNLNYMSSTTLVGGLNHVDGLIIRPDKGFVIKKQFQPIKNFNFDGTSRGYSNSFAGNFFMNDHGNLYTGMTVESFYELFYIE